MNFFEKIQDKAIGLFVAGLKKTGVTVKLNMVFGATSAAKIK